MSACSLISWHYEDIKKIIYMFMKTIICYFEMWGFSERNLFRIYKMKCVLKCPHNVILYGGSREPVNPKGNWCWILIGSTNVEVEAPILWPPDGKSLLIGKDLDAGRMEGRRKGQQRWLDEMRWIVVWHHWLSRHELEQTLGDSEGQENLVCCNPWGRKESDRETEQLENQEVSMCALNKPAISEVHS